MKTSKNTLARIVVGIQSLLSGNEWDADTLQEVADILERNGFPVKDTSDEEDEDGEDS